MRQIHLTSYIRISPCVLIVALAILAFIDTFTKVSILRPLSLTQLCLMLYMQVRYSCLHQLTLDITALQTISLLHIIRHDCQLQCFTWHLCSNYYKIITSKSLDFSTKINDCSHITILLMLYIEKSIGK